MTVLCGEDMVGGYGGADILRGCTVAAEAGRIAVIAGPNGAGKSTAMKALFGMVRLRRGRVVLDGEVIIAPKGVMNKDAQSQIEESVRTCTGRGQWSKIILMSRFQTVEPPGKQEKWYWPLWEDPRHAPLPRSPA